MEERSEDFGLSRDRVWLNCAHQGPLPNVAEQAVREAIAWKRQPHNLVTERFQETPRRLRDAIGRLIGAPAGEIVLANSASYGLHLLANAVPFEAGDEILLFRGDFPSDILPWLGLQERGVVIRYLEPAGAVPEPEELERALTPRTRLFCTTWVHSFSGWAVDLEALGSLCRLRGVTFVLNASQAIGARPFNVASAPVDAVTSVGFKWLLGPYGTGFLWMRPELLEALRYNQSYWLAMQTADDLGSASDTVAIREGLGSRKYDIFGTANFFNYKPWTASIEYLLKRGIDRVAEYDQTLVSRLVEELNPKKYRLVSPASGARRSTLIVFTHTDPGRNREIHQALWGEGIHLAYRRSCLRAAPHLYNTAAEIDHVLERLEQLG